MLAMGKVLMDIEANIIASEVSVYCPVYSDLTMVAEALIGSTDFEGSFTIKAKPFILEYRQIQSILTHKMLYQKEKGPAAHKEYELLADCAFKEVFSKFPKGEATVTIECDIRFTKFSDNTVQMTCDNVTDMSAKLELDASSDFNKFIASAIRRFDVLHTLVLACGNYIPAVMKAVVASASIAYLGIDDRGLSINDRLEIEKDYRDAGSIQTLEINGHNLYKEKLDLIVSVAHKWKEHKDSNYFTESELAFFYKYRTLIHNRAIANNLWGADYNLEDDILLKFSELRGGGKGAIESHCNVFAHSGHLTKDVWISFIKKSKANPFKTQLKRDLTILAESPPLDRLLTKRALANSLMFEPLYMVLMLKFSSYTAIPVIMAIQTFVMFWDRDRAKSKPSLQFYYKSVGDKSLDGYDSMMWSMSSFSIAILLIPVKILAEESGVSSHIVLVLALSKVAHSGYKCWIECEKRGYEENIYVAGATSAIYHLWYSVEGVEGMTVSVKIAANICVFAGFYMYDKYQDKLHQERVREKELELQSSVAI